MNIIRQSIERLRGWLSHKSSRKGKSLILVHRGNVPDNPEAGHLAAMGLHEACTRAHIGASLVDIDEWILRACLNEGRFDPHRLGDLTYTDFATGEPAWERTVKSDIVWLLRNRRQMLHQAYNASGDAEVSIVLGDEDGIEPILCVDFSRVASLTDINLHPAPSSQPGFIGTLGARKQAMAFRFGVNAADDRRTWDTVLKRCLKPGE